MTRPTRSSAGPAALLEQIEFGITDTDAAVDESDTSTPSIELSAREPADEQIGNESTIEIPQGPVSDAGHAEAEAPPSSESNA